MSKKDDVKISSYQLVRPYWNNRQVVEKGEVVDFPEGKQPRGSVKLTELQAKELRGRAIEVATDPMKAELAALQAQVEEMKAQMKGGDPVSPEVKEPASDPTPVPEDGETKIAPKGK